jgi:hypothetical protein
MFQPLCWASSGCTLSCCKVSVQCVCLWGKVPESQVLEELVENSTVEVGVLGRVHTKLTETKQTETKHKQNWNKSEATIHTHTHIDRAKWNHLLDASVFYPVQRQWTVAVKWIHHQAFQGAWRWGHRHGFGWFYIPCTKKNVYIYVCVCVCMCIYIYI